MPITVRPPRVPAPAGTIDTSIHIVGDYAKYPAAPTAVLKPPLASVADYGREIGDGIGIRRAFVVQASTHGLDNRCILDALAEMGDNAWGVAVVPASISEAQIQDLHDRRVRGLRFFMVERGGVYAWSDVEDLCAKIAPFGWFAQFQFDGATFPDRVDLLERLRLPVVIDQQGKFAQPFPADHAAVRRMVRFLGRDNAWLKIAAPYELSQVGGPGYEDVGAIARILIAAAPERTIWASCWPHFNRAKTPADNAMLLDLLFDWAGEDVALYNRILAENPLRLLGSAS